MTDIGTDVAHERREPPAWQRWLETLGVAAALLAAGALLDRSDPFLLKRGFSWLALAPLLAGLRYGAVPGMACGAAQGLALVAAAAAARMQVPGPAAEAVLGWLLAGLIPGEFRDAWLRRSRRLEAAFAEMGQRLVGLGRELHLQRLALDRLQHAAPGRPPGLREALGAFRREVAERLEGSLEPVADRILSLLCEQVGAQAATLHRVDAEGRPGPALAARGAAAGPGDHPLVRDAARLGEVVSVRDRPEAAAVLAAVPLVDARSRVHAVVAIREMPFVALHKESLRLLAVLGGCIGDALARANLPLSRSGRAERWFCLGLGRALADARRHGIPASLLVARVKAPGSPEAARALALRISAERRRTDDAAVLLEADGSAAVLLLLRLAGAEGLEGYRARLHRLVRDQVPGGRAAVAIRAWPLQEAPLPGRPDDLEASLRALVRAAEPEAQRGERTRHGLVASRDAARIG